MDYKIFKDENEEEQARQRLPELQEHPGWKIIIRALDVNINQIEEELDQWRSYQGDDGTKLRELCLLLDRREDLRKYKELPILLLKELQPDIPQSEPSADPY